MNNEIQFILYQLPDEEGKVQVVIKDETIWATQKAMAQLFDVNIPAISKHLKNIFDEDELQPDATVSKMEIVQMEGEREVKRETTFYSLDAIIAVGYRVSSARATKWPSVDMLFCPIKERLVVKRQTRKRQRSTGFLIQLSK